MTKKISTSDLLEVLDKVKKETINVGFTLNQLALEAGYKNYNLNHLKNPTLKTLIKLLEALDRLKQKIN